LEASGIIRAAGGVPWRRRADGQLEVLLVHRPHYDDWTFPKGKAKDGESDEEAAIREVEEETGLTCELGNELATTHYVDRRGRSKYVRYWTMGPSLQRQLRGTRLMRLRGLPGTASLDD
jgi:8-oxo-dGTP diphosphatase